VPPSKRTSQPSVKSRPGLGAAPASDLTLSTVADNHAAAVAKIADGAVESVTDVVQASIGAEGASKVKELIKQVGALLGGNGSSGSHQGLMEHVANAGGDLVQAISGMHGGLLGRDEGAPIPDNYNLAVQPLAAFYYDYEQTSTELMGQTAAAVGELAQAVGRVLSGSVAPNQEAGVPATPAAPPPVPAAPPVLPLGYSSSLLVASGSAADAFQLLFAVLALFSVALLQGGRLSWLRRESHGPPTAVVLAIERPG
jgi:hypothetical protein